VDRIFCKFKAIHNRKICIRSAGNKLNPHFLKAVKGLGLTSIDQIEPHSPIRNHVDNRMDILMRVAGDDWSLAKNESSGILRHSYGSRTSLPSLPDDCSEGEHNCPCSDSFRPCYEFVPPLRLILVGLLVVASGLIVGYGRGRNIRLLCVTLALSCILPSGWLLLLGNRWYCESKGSEQNQISQHRDEETLAQTEITNNFDCVALTLRPSGAWVGSEVSGSKYGGTSSTKFSGLVHSGLSRLLVWDDCHISWSGKQVGASSSHEPGSFSRFWNHTIGGSVRGMGLSF
jgi:hypothetical protein